MPYAGVGGLSIYYETHGDDASRAIVLIRGLGTQLIDWAPALLDGFVSSGLRVVVFDNRDAGLSSAVTEACGDPPYRLEDMAGDVVGLLDHLGIDRAHVFGISLGGMIAQHVALAFPNRVRSLISVMSTTSDPSLPQPSREIRERLVATADTEDGLIALDAESRAAFGSPGYPESSEVRLAAARAAYARSYRPDGVTRQLRAAIADGSRRERLRTIAVPTLVIHGADDPLIPAAAGRDTAESIPGARLEIVPGMGHNIPNALAPTIVDCVVRFVRDVDTRAG